MSDKTLDRVLTLELARVTERAAVAASFLIGRGNEKEADQAAVDAMRTELNQLNINGEVVIGEGERDEAPMLYIGEKIGTGKGPKVDIALDPLEGTTLTAKGQADALTTIAMAEKGSLLNAPDVYMQKIAIGPGCPEGIIFLEEDPDKNVIEFGKAINKPVEQITVCVLDRPRHDNLIETLRSVGAKVKLIQDGDIAGVIHTTEKSTGIDMYMGIGGAPEGVLAAAALRCIGGQMQTKLVLEDQEKKDRASKLGIKDVDKIYNLDDMVGGDALFAATGVTNGSILSGIKIDKGIWTNTLVMRSSSKTVRWITAHHQNIDKFNSTE
ncbi:MAG: class II fructose-bisphosphatase [Pseudomonadota bacterium]|nr:class II fructose-bisphosphatase [Pseudomonadota bacterium]MEC9392632.1 class II fructose-bisphosphatase [Pseudomonadota bacterium]